MGAAPLFLAALALFSLITAQPLSSEKHTEEASVSVLPDQSVHLLFQFSTLRNNTPENKNHYHLFPRPLGDIADAFGIEEMRLAFTRGRWLSSWGAALAPAPIGAEVYAWLRNDTGDSVDNAWVGLTSALSGYFCASLNRIGKLQATSMPPALHSSALPQETVCTENLTPWLKLLPCKTQLGLGALIQPLKIYASQFHSYTVHVRHIGREQVELTQTLAVVFQSQSSALGKREFNIKHAFGTEPTRCPSAVVSKIYLLRTPFTPTLTISPPPTSPSSPSSGDMESWSLSSTGVPLRLSWADTPAQAPSAPGVERHLLGYGQRHSVLRTSVSNPLPIGLYFTYHETYPSFALVYFHTLMLQFSEHSNNFTSSSFSPARSGRPGSLALSFYLPPSTSVTWSLELERSILHWEEYPPDAHRGFDLPPSVLSYSLSANAVHDALVRVSPATDVDALQDVWMRTYTAPLLLLLPSPDFSTHCLWLKANLNLCLQTKCMPYNVITLSGTVFAFFFGSLLRAMSRSLRPLKMSKKGSPKAKTGFAWKGYLCKEN